MSFITKAVATGANVMLNGAGALSDYENRRGDGHGVATSAIKAGVGFAVDSAIMAIPYVGQVYMGLQMAGAGVDIAKQYLQTTGKEEAKKIQGVHRGNIGGHFIDTQNAATMRQKGLKAMEMSNYNISSVLGSEARTFHRGIAR